MTGLIHGNNPIKGCGTAHTACTSLSGSIGDLVHGFNLNLAFIDQHCSGPSTNKTLLVCSYKKLPVDVQPGSQILCADGSIVLEVLKCNPDQGTVRCRCTNNATLGYDLLSKPIGSASIHVMSSMSFRQIAQ